MNGTSRHARAELFEYTRNQGVKVVAVDDSLAGPLNRFGLHLQVRQHEHVVQPNRKASLLEPRAHGAVLQTNLGRDVLCLVAIALEDAVGSKLDPVTCSV